MIATRKEVDAALAVLDVAEPFTSEDVKLAYRAKVQTAHPDKGGSPEAFALVDRAKHVLLRWLEQGAGQKTATGAGRECTRCQGRGYVESHRGFRALKMQCPQCRGSGDLDTEHEKGDFR